jgi:hypothetical protein
VSYLSSHIFKIFETKCCRNVEKEKEIKKRNKPNAEREREKKRGGGKSCGKKEEKKNEREMKSTKEERENIFV